MQSINCSSMSRALTSPCRIARCTHILLLSLILNADTVHLISPSFQPPTCRASQALNAARISAARPLQRSHPVFPARAPLTTPAFHISYSRPKMKPIALPCASGMFPRPVRPPRIRRYKRYCCQNGRFKSRHRKCRFCKSHQSKNRHRKSRIRKTSCSIIFWCRIRPLPSSLPALSQKKLSRPQQQTQDALPFTKLSTMLFMLRKATNH